MRKSQRPKIHRPSTTKHPHRKKSMRQVDNTKDLDLFLEKNKTLQDILGFSREKLGTLFDQAIALLQASRFDEAIQGFSFLSRVNPYVSDFWVGLGLAREGNGDYKGALEDFYMAITMDPSRLESYIYAVDCCLELGKISQADTILHSAKSFLRRHPRLEEADYFLHEILRLEESIQEKKNNHKKKPHKKFL